MELTADMEMLKALINENGHDNAPIKTERTPGVFISCLVAVGPDETAEIILTKEAYNILMQS